MADTLVSVKAVAKEARSRQAQLIVATAFRNCRGIRYQTVLDNDYKYWLDLCEMIPNNQELAKTVRQQLLSTNDIRFIGMWQQVCNFLENGLRAECVLFVDNFFKTHFPAIRFNEFNSGSFHKTLRAVVHPYRFNDTKLQEVI